MVKKIPTLFVRDRDDMRYVTRDVTPGCEWVIAGEGRATRKYDGTCMLFDGRWWARREVKPGRDIPPAFFPVEDDPVTGKRVGWEPVEQSSFAKYFREALTHSWPGLLVDGKVPLSAAGTYELVGPKVNGNPEGMPVHYLVRHGEDVLPAGLPRDFDAIRNYLLNPPHRPIEGIVFWRDDAESRMVKIKARDFRSEGARGEH